jgi:[ribosomal protein S18]-alanine N-acetyltransferase
VIVRPALPVDAAAVARIEEVASEVRWTATAVRRMLSDPGGEGWLAGDPPCGHLLTRRTLDEAEILTIAVLPEARRRGCGHVLLGACEEQWRQTGVRTGWLEVRADNVPALALYRSHGWQDAGFRHGYYSDGADARVLRWSTA